MSGYRELNLTAKLFSLQQIVHSEAFKSDTAVFTFSFRSLSSPLFSLFLPLSFFILCWAFSRLHIGENIWGKYFRILGLDERKGRWVVTQDFHGNFSGYGRGFKGEWVD